METQNVQLKSTSNMSHSDMISLTTLVILVLSILWNVFVVYAGLDGKIEKVIIRIDAIQDDIVDIKKDIEKIENRLDRIEDNLHKIDIRVTTLEQKKP